MPKQKRKTRKIRKISKRTPLLPVGSLAALVIFIIFVFLLIFKQLGVFNASPAGPPAFIVPTLTPKEFEIAKNKVTHTVTIQNNQVKPANLKIKLHDQIIWVNKDKETHQIKGDNWGNVPIKQGESFTQTFDQIGTFPYICSIQTKLQGKIVVVEK